MLMPDQPSQAVQDYLKAIHSLGGSDHVVLTVDIADRLGVRAPSVTGMLKRLADAGWIDYKPGAGATLTAQGVAEARRVIRRHRLVELFLTRVLGLDWSEVDTEAEALEHAISPRLEQALAAHLGEPLEDPHGHPIPTREGDMARRDLLPLSAFRPGQRALIREARDDSPERLRRWQTLGLTPGAVVHFVNHQPLDDLFEVEVAGRRVPLGSEGLEGLLGERLPDDEGERGVPPDADR
jgi:DtxR family transcriptional regulator, Mn-dependent transcriptional regulator